jgi:hypothetical protein
MTTAVSGPGTIDSTTVATGETIAAIAGEMVGRTTARTTTGMAARITATITN